MWGVGVGLERRDGSSRTRSGGAVALGRGSVLKFDSRRTIKRVHCTTTSQPQGTAHDQQEGSTTHEAGHVARFIYHHTPYLLHARRTTRLRQPVRKQHGHRQGEVALAVDDVDDLLDAVLLFVNMRIQEEDALKAGILCTGPLGFSKRLLIKNTPAHSTFTSLHHAPHNHTLQTAGYRNIRAVRRHKTARSIVSIHVVVSFVPMLSFRSCLSRLSSSRYFHPCLLPFALQTITSNGEHQNTPKRRSLFSILLFSFRNFNHTIGFSHLRRPRPLLNAQKITTETTTSTTRSLK